MKPVVLNASLAGLSAVVTVREPNVSARTAETLVAVDNASRRDRSAAALSVFRSRYFEAVNGCYESARKIEPGVGGRVNVTMLIEPSGRIQSIELSQLQDTVFAKCLNEKAMRWRFPEMPSATVIEYSLNLVPL